MSVYLEIVMSIQINPAFSGYRNEVEITVGSTKLTLIRVLHCFVIALGLLALATVFLSLPKETYLFYGAIGTMLLFEVLVIILEKLSTTTFVVKSCI